MNDDAQVIVKRAIDRQAAPAHDFRREYELLQSLDIPGVARPAGLVSEGGSLSMVLQDFPGESLEALLNDNRRLDLTACLQIAVNLARILFRVHAERIIHLDVRPANVLVETAHWEALLADFSIAASGEPGFMSPGPAGDWAYMSPEQTGRMNRTVDYRTDFYSFGVTLYRMLTGRLPFSAEDPLEWTHCHIARRPQPPSGLCPDLPQPVSDIVMKLMAKLPEDRYQSMRGLQADLERCLREWLEKACIEPFPLGEKDDPERFRLPRKLYGREQESAALQAAFEQAVSGGRATLVTIAGYAGVGKSALVGELFKPIVERRGNFISDKFDQHQRDIPYVTITHAFRDLVQQLLAESEERIAGWRTRILEAVGANGQLVVDLLPQLELIIGKQPPVPPLPLAQAEHRFHDVFRRFASVFTSNGQPLVLFLDDVQWIDPASLKLVEHLFADAVGLGHLLLIAAYRHNEVDPGHPLLAALDAVRRHGTTPHHIRLAPLSLKHLNRMASDILRTPAPACEPLARLVFDKTDGNPFFFIQFLVSLHEENLLWWNADDREWRWDLGRIKVRNFADNVVGLMVGKLRRLPDPVQRVLEIAACLGNKFDLRNIALAIGTSESDIRQQLSAPLQENLITCTNIACRFLHDRIQQAAYSLIPEARQGEMHLAIGRALLSGLSADELAEQVFDVANLFNRGAGLVVEQEEKIRVAEINLRAGRKAKASAAPASALNYFAAGVRLLQEDDWLPHYRLMFDLWLECASCEYLLSNFDAARGRIAILLQKGASRIDLAAAYHMKVLVHEMESEHQQAVDSALDCLRLFGMDIPPHPGEETVRQEAEAVWRNLGDRAIEQLVDLPCTSDPEMQAVMDILQTVHTAAFLTDVNLSNLLPCRIINLGMRHGVTGAFAHGCGWFGAGLGPLFHRYDEGYRFARLACQIIEKHGFVANKAKAYFAMEMAALWTQPVSTALEYVRTACRCAVEAGDLPLACYSWAHILTDLRLRGDSLDSVERELEQGLEFVRRTRFRLVADGIVAQQRFIAAMRGHTGSFGSFDGAQFEEATFEVALAQGRERTLVCFYWILKLMARFMAGDHAAALFAADQARALLPAASSRIQMLDYVYFSALTMAALYDEAEAKERREWRAMLTAHQVQLHEWMENCPSTFLDKFTLVSAEIARIDGQDFESVLRLYQQAIQAARESGFVHTEGIAHELAAGFHFARGFPVGGKAHLEQARSCYVHWGAAGKVAQLERQYPELHAEHAKGAATRPGELQLDLQSVIKATQAISGHIVLDELIDTLMRIVAEHAGAQAGCLLLVRKGELVLAAEAAVQGQSLQVKRGEAAVLPQGRLPAAILNYVRRSREQVLLMDASEPHPFAADPYFATRHPKSVLCLPILRQSALVGLLYLENDLASHAFTPGHAKVLEVLAGQAAISLENARLFSDLHKENIERKRTEDALREREARIRQLVESNIIGVFFFDMHGGMSDANDALLDMLGYGRNDLLAGKLKWTSLTPPASRALDAEKETELRRTGRCTPYEKEFVRKDGSLVPVLVGAALFEGSQERGVAFVLDISDRKKTEVEREARRAAEAANRAKSAFLASMSHELRTPLNAILGYAQILSRETWPQQGRMSGLDVIQQSGEHLLNLINDILDLAKIEADKLELCPSDLALAPFLRALADMVAVRAEQKGVAFRCELAPDLPAGVRTDEQRLRQVLLNLLSNAVKFTDRGIVTFSVCCMPGGHVRFEVTDTGIGIPAGRQEALFEPFVQLGAARYRLGGTGLGLSISRKIVRLMGGDIHVESVTGQGSRFWFALDLPSVPATELPGAATQPVGAIAGYSGARKTILVVDDIAENRAVLADMLVPLGFRLFEACSGEECLEKVPSLQPDLVLMDIVMPELGGLEAIRGLRQIPACRDIPVIAVSASASLDDAQTCRSAGANAFVPKPVDFGKLLASMADLLHLCWIYKLPDSRDAETREATGESFGLPPVSEMMQLLQLAKLGNMQEILAWADRIAAADPASQPFVAQLRELAVNYQSKAILQLVERHSGGMEADQPGR